ncbi:MAG: RecQ family ATP-dependent DNA helicase [Pseudanabaenaceae cyanobacterium bins.68]|nr:RecQ family ATP-dependent DNA helicase [Pseudanabaenaceae cyanobacterium bins.68]
MPDPSAQLAEIKRSLQRIWGYEDFRPLQLEVITSILAGQDSLVIVSTGGGKSLCFQLPAIMQQGLTLVISPLLSLIENQVQELRHKKLPAAALHSAMATSQRRQVLSSLSQLRLLYLSPETLLSPTVWQKLLEPQIQIKALIVDEAHVLVQWGDRFRPDFRRLGAVRASLTKNANQPSIAAFTATANPQAQAQLINCLQLVQPQQIITSPYRSNLALKVAIAWTAQQRKTATLEFVRRHGHQSGLIYVRSRRSTEEIAAWLGTLGMKTKPYHAGLVSTERRQIEQDWQSGQLPLVVATSAFGMGIDKANVRWVLHFQPPLTLAEYIQEVGRAGRDRALAEALMLVSEPTGLLDGSDRAQREFYLSAAAKQQQQAQALLTKLPRRGSYTELSPQFANLDLLLGLLHSANQLIWHSPFEFEILCSPNFQFAPPDRSPLLEMQDFINTKTCRWAFLVKAFGFSHEAQNLKCGICDRCLAQAKSAKG